MGWAEARLPLRRSESREVSPAVWEFAKAAYEFTCEITSPAPDLAMRAVTRQKLVEADAKLSVGDRQLLGR